jgi:hypothetical protein
MAADQKSLPTFYRQNGKKKIDEFAPKHFLSPVKT